MKFNFRKIASVIASAVMIGSTVGMAAAVTYPQPFQAAGDYAIVVGQAGATTDYNSAVSLSQNLLPKVAPSSNTVTVPAGSFTLESGRTYLHLGNGLADVQSTIDKTDMPSLLAKQTYRSHDSQTYDYTQELTLANSSFTYGQDPTVNNDIPVVGVFISDGAPILNYTAEFTPALTSSVSDGRLADLEDTQITLLGKEYTLLNAYNASSDTKLELMAGAATDTVNLNEQKDIPVGDKTYSIQMTFVDSDSAKFTVNGESTGSLSVGSTYKLSDGTQFGVRDISYQNFAGGVMAAEVSIGAEKLTLENGQTVQLNDKDVDGLTAYIDKTAGSSGDEKISSIKIQWDADDDYTITPDQTVTMPGFNSVTLGMSNMTMPEKEITKVVNDGPKAMKIEAPLLSGNADVDLLYGNETAFTGIGKDSTHNLITNTTALNITSNSDKFIASWSNSDTAKSYLLGASFSTQDSVDYVTIKDLVTNEVAGTCDTLKAGDTCKVDSDVKFTIDSVDKSAENVHITAIGSTTFNNLYTADGLKLALPVDGTPVAINATDGPASYKLQFTEADKDGNIAKGSQFNVTVDWSSSKTEVSSVDGGFAGGQMFTIGDSDVEAGYLASALATYLTYDTTPTQATATIEYHGGETYGNVFVASPEMVSTGSSGSTAALKVVYDKDASTVSAKDLIVVGGSCINTVAQQIIAPSASAPVCGADFTAQTQVGAGQYLIKTVASPLNSAKVAVLVAGYDAADTQNAVTTLMTENVTTDVGSSNIYPLVGGSI